MPEATAASVASGAWVDAVVECVRHLDEPLVHELSRPHRRVNGEDIGVWLVGQLREMDTAVRTFITEIDRRTASDVLPEPTVEARAVVALRARHRAERRELAARHRREMNEFAAARRGV